MPQVNVLIKPASSACDLNCRYCFYKDVSEHRQEAFAGLLRPERMEQILDKAMEAAEGDCTFAFQGGEPTLAGLDFFRTLVQLQKEKKRPGLRIHNTIQTNGCSITPEWAAFLAENHFLVGLSLDGPKELHDANRVTRKGEGTWHRVMETARLFEQYGVEYNILSVVTGQNARFIQKTYRFFAEQSFGWLQFIPCLEPLDAQRGDAGYALSPKAYGDFLIRIFDLWLQDLRRGRYVSIRHIDNWVGMLMGRPPEACSMTGRCSIQFVVEGDGSVYPCDFYVLDQWRLGSVETDSFRTMASSETARRFLAASCRVPETCRACPIYPICRNGCRRDRLMTPEGLVDRSYYCESYRRFFTERRRELGEAVQLIRRMQNGLM